MFGSEILEVAIGMVFIFIIVSTLCSAIREGLEAWLNTRAAYLEHGIRTLLHDPEGTGLAGALYNHPLIYSLFNGEYKPGSGIGTRPPLLAKGADLPSYIPSKNFALALMDMAARGPKTNLVNSDPTAPVIDLQEIRANVLKLDNEKVQRALLAAIDSAQGDLNRVQKNIEAWFDSSMDRVSGWYKRSTQWVVLGIGLLIAVGLNIDSISLADYLYRNNAVRAQIVAEAEQAKPSAPDFEKTKQELMKLELPIGWPRPASSQVNAAMIFFGWLLTALAATVGAPFWFDILNKIMVIRATVKPHEKSPEESSEDRQKKAQPQPLFATMPFAPASTAEMPQAPPPRPQTSDDDLRDGCSAVEAAPSVTSDEELPQATGGVA